MYINSSRLSFQTAVINTSGFDADVSSRFDLDRYMGDVLVLPYEFNEVRIKSNDLCVADNINASFAKLHHNFLYINANTKIADNKFPLNYKGFIASTSATSYSGVGWYPSLSATDDIPWQLSTRSATTTLLSGIVAGDFVQTDYSASEYFGIVALSGSIIGIKSDNTGTSAYINLQKSTIEDSSGIDFTDIKSLEIDSEYNVIIADDVYLHKLDITPLLTTNRAISSIGRFLIKTIGGRSTDLYDKSKFNNPVDIAIGNDDVVYVLDKGDNGIKKYDNGLNWIDTSGRANQFTAPSLSGGRVVSIAVNKRTDFVYVITDNGILFEYDENLTGLQTINFTEPLATGETYKKITFSNNEAGVVYVMTSKNLYKKFITRLDRSIGAFRLDDNKITNQTLAFCSVMKTPDVTYDYVFVGSNSTHDSMTTNIGKVLKFDENIFYRTLVHDDYKTDLIALTSVNVIGAEYVTDTTVNKSLNKLLFNHLIFRDNFLMKYVGAYDAAGRVQLTSTQYLTESQFTLSGYEITQDHFIGLNEPVFADNINRTLKKVYDLQIDLLDLCKEKITNKFPFAAQVITLK